MRPLHPSRAFLLFLLLAAGGVLAARRSYAQEELLDELKTVASVRFEGRHHLSAGDIRRQIKTRGPSFWPWHAKPTLRKDFVRVDTLAIAALYRHYGYLDCQVVSRIASTRKTNEVSVTFVITEGPEYRIAAVELAGLAAYPSDQLGRKLWARVGKPFDPSYLQLDTLRISELYQDRGYRPHVHATYRNEAQAVTVHYDVSEGPLYRVGEVYLFSQSSTPTVEERLVRRELLLKQGDVYRRSRVLRSVERLYETTLFSQVQVTPLPDSSNTLMEFQIGYRERKPRWIDAGVGSGTNERFRFTGEWGHRNILGQGLQGAVSSRLSFNGKREFQLWHTEASLLEPWLFRSRTRGTFTPFYERSDDRADPHWVIRQEAKGLNLQLQRELGRYTRVLLTQSNVFATQTYEFTDTTSVPISRRDSVAASVVSSYTTHRLGLGVERDLRDNPLDAIRGSAQAVNLEIAGGPFRGRSSFRKAQVVSAWYTPLGATWVLASRVRAGTIRPFGSAERFSPGEVVDSEVGRLPVEDRFRIGGVNSIRGFNENGIQPSGGLAVLQANIELRVPVWGPLGVEAYIDAGNVWTRPGHVRWHQFTPKISREVEIAGSGDVRYAVGIGPRVKLPIGPLRIDFTWTLRPADGGPGYGRAATQFAVGPSF